jgi:hypothetical protein
MSRHQNAGQYRDIKTGILRNVAKFKYLGTIGTDQNFIHEEEPTAQVRLVLVSTLVLPAKETQ